MEGMIMIDSYDANDDPLKDFDEGMCYKMLLEVNNAIISQTTSDDLFRSLANVIRKIVHYDRFSICIYDATSEMLNWFAVAEGVAVEGIDASLRPLDKGSVAYSVITSREPVVIPDMHKYLHWPSIKMMMEKGLRSTIAFPLITRGQVVGTLHISFKKIFSTMDKLAKFMCELSKQVAIAVDNMLAHTELLAINRNLKQQNEYLITKGCTDISNVFYRFSNPVMKSIIEQVKTVANSDMSILITGETGTGKDYLANYIHSLSNRRNALFVKINCPALAESLFESELFGHAKGAFTGANAKRIGRFEMANGGTVFLDEIGELSPALQAKLLHVIQDKKFERIGENKSVTVDFRVIAATNVDLENAIREKKFRSDLYYRLNTVSFHMPPLRERVDEIEHLVHQITQMYTENIRCNAPLFTEDVFKIFMNYSWPGNIRELQNIVKRLVIAYHGRKVTAREVEPLLGISTSQHSCSFISSSDMQTLEEIEKSHLIKALTITKGIVGGNKGAARLLQLPKSTLQYKLRKHNINPLDFIGR